MDIVAQVSYRQKKFRKSFYSSALAKLERRTWHALTSRQSRLLVGWGVGLSCFVGLLLWDAKLVLATSLGIGTMWGLYWLQGWDWPTIEAKLMAFFFQSRERRLIMAIAGGGLATLGTYLAASVWLNTENRWMATGIIFQGFGTISILGLLGWQLLTRPLKNAESQFNQLVLQLNDRDPLRRLILVRQLTRLTLKLNQSDYSQQLWDYFQKMLSQESDAMVRESLLEGLHQLMPQSPVIENASPLQVPLRLEKTKDKVG